MLTADDVKKWLGLTANPQEGGFLAGVYESPVRVPNSVLKGFPPAKQPRSICGAIYYFLDATFLRRGPGADAPALPRGEPQSQ